MKKILSIDFDCIMYPCIKLYNDKCHGDENPTIGWKKLSIEMDIDKFLSYDAQVLEDIILLVQRSVSNGAVLIPIQEHQELVKHLDMESDEKIDLINIDFHHDIWYNRDSISSIKLFNQYNCADWVGYLMKKDKLNSYTWYKMPNSDMFLDNMDIPFTIKKIKEIKELDEKFDTIYFCLSPQWVPYKYHHLYDLIIKLFGGKPV